MFLQRVTTVRHFLATVLIFTLTGSTALPAFAGVALNTIDPVARVTDDGQQLVVTGPIVCTDGERATLHVTVTQRSTGAIAHGRTRFKCMGALQQWEVRVANHGTDSFEEGSATAVARARTTAQGEPTDAHQWLVDVQVTK